MPQHPPLNDVITYSDLITRWKGNVDNVKQSIRDHITANRIHTLNVEYKHRLTSTETYRMLGSGTYHCAKYDSYQPNTDPILHPDSQLCGDSVRNIENDYLIDIPPPLTNQAITKSKPTKTELLTIGLLIKALGGIRPYTNPSGAPNLSRIKALLIDIADKSDIVYTGIGNADDPKGIFKRALNHLDTLKK